jgi:type I restriction enzyme M protein
LSIEVRDALGSQGGKYYEMVMTNPPFGKKSSVTIVNEKGEAEKESLTIHRDDFWASTSNKQLNFLQHVFTILKQHGRVAIVVSDNVLFEGGAVKPFAANCSSKRTCIRFCVCRRVSSTRRA